ncbi:sensor histidine kinase [Nocardioides mangrovi]|uniref:histidine kinase n=1 Tax=Nocardioides mangrovi TaxID=2874580 RepID=A0ABS7UJG6_9ACTN|nr:ATP-binding protein [Nocardioides mangrovi]MBZ5741022.1 HAMP domain-containing histidine kinase [Nocardioides mangrovi]
MTDPRVFQYGFTALYLLDLGLRYAFGARWPWVSWPMASLLIVAVLAAVTPLLRPGRAPHAPIVLAVADLLAVGLARLDPDAGSGLLIVMPVLWLGRIAGRRGVVISVVAVVLLVSVPSIMYAGFAPVETARAVLYPVVAGAAALVIAESMEWVNHERAEAEHQRDRLAGALETIAHQRRVSDAIFDTVDVGLLLLDGSGRYIGMNRRHQEFVDLGYPDGHDGRAGQESGLVFDADGRTPLAAEAAPSSRAAQGEEFDEVRIWVGEDPETRRAISVSARAIRSEDGTFEGAALGYTDVTDIMRALQVKNEFVALVSHELRTPLTSIVGYSQLLEDDTQLSLGARKHLAVIQRNTERLHRLIADLLSVAQHDAGAVDYARERIDLADVVRDTVDAMGTAAEESGVDLSMVAPDSMAIVADAQRIAQVVDNLVSNAVKYTQSGGSVRVRLAGEDHQAVLEVTDTGIGIEPDDIDRLFNRFFRSREAERRAIAGAGLGLSIAKDIVEGHGGRVEVESRPGHGSRFRVLLPLGR